MARCLLTSRYKKKNYHHTQSRQEGIEHVQMLHLPTGDGDGTCAGTKWGRANLPPASPSPASCLIQGPLVDPAVSRFLTSLPPPGRLLESSAPQGLCVLSLLISIPSLGQVPPPSHQLLLTSFSNVANLENSKSPLQPFCSRL